LGNFLRGEITPTADGYTSPGREITLPAGSYTSSVTFGASFPSRGSLFVGLQSSKSLYQRKKFGEATRKSLPLAGRVVKEQFILQRTNEHPCLDARLFM